MTNLFIKIDFGNTPSTDNGSRPYTGSTPLWVNSSIFLTGGVTQTQTRVGSPTTINVRVSNAEKSPFIEDVTVDAYVMNPFMGAFDPNNAIVRVKGFAPKITLGSGGSSTNDPHVVECLVQDPVQGAIPWTPTQEQFVKHKDGHLCLVANCYADGDGGPLPLTQIFAVGSDPHQGQRNIWILAGRKKVTMMVDVMPGPDGGDTALDLHRLSEKAAVQGGDYWLLQSHPKIVEMKDSPLGLGIPGRGGKPDVPLTRSDKEISGSLDIEGIGSIDLGDLAKTPKELRLEQPTPAVITVDRSDAPGSLQVFDIVQRTVKDGVLGGLRVLSVQF